MSQHIVPIKVYIAIFTALLALTAITTAVGYVDLGRLNALVALFIAVIKATLVILFFMHLRYSGSLPRLVLASSLFWLVLLMGLTLSDVLTRHWIPIPKGWIDLSTFSSHP